MAVGLNLSNYCFGNNRRIGRISANRCIDCEAKQKQKERKRMRERKSGMALVSVFKQMPNYYIE